MQHDQHDSPNQAVDHVTKMFVGPHKASELRTNGLWDPQTMTTDKAEAEASTRAFIPPESGVAAPMKPPLPTNIVVELCPPPSEHPTMPRVQTNDSVSPSRNSVADISLQLSDRIADLARELLGEPNGAHSSKSQLRYGKKGSIAIEIDGPKAGRWYDHEEGVGGGPLELIRRENRMAPGEAVGWARQWLGLPRGTHGSARPKAAQTYEPKGADEEDKGSSSEDESTRAAKIAAILASTEPIAGTPGELYLRGRGITVTPPECIRFRRRAFGQYGAVVALATDADGKVLALQQIYVSEEGCKAPIPVPKRTNKAVDGWAEKAAVRLPGSQPLILCEGPETGMSIWQATGQETWACLGIANIGHAPVPDEAAVIIARDGDDPGGKADRQIAHAAAAMRKRVHSLSMACPPSGEDFNDVLANEGPDVVRQLIEQAQPIGRLEPAVRSLDIGSDVEIAHRVRTDLTDQFGQIVHAEGAFWRYEKTRWEAIPDHEMRRAVHQYDGAGFFTPSGSPARVALTKGRVDSALNEGATLCADPGFFEKRPVGINCTSGFIRFGADGTPAIEPHHRDHRCRHTLPGRWEVGATDQPPENSLLHRLLDGVFQGDGDAAEKVALLSEVCGCAALGYATQLVQPRAVILCGQTAENGKSQILDLARGLLPSSAVCSVPAARMGDERHIVGLVGKQLNATDELSSGAISSDTFKSVVTGEPVEGRDVYKSRVEFRPIAQNVFATNNLPPFLGGMDRGVQRRLLVVPFNRTIPAEDRIEHIGRRIAEEEADLLLAWAVNGASRLIRKRNFSLPPSCKQALADWIFGADPVLAWLSERVDVQPVVSGKPVIATRTAYSNFQTWAVAEGFKGDKVPAINGFVQRVLANAKGVEYHRTGKGRRFLGLVIKEVTSMPF